MGVWTRAHALVFVEGSGVLDDVVHRILGTAFMRRKLRGSEAQSETFESGTGGGSIRIPVLGGRTWDEGPVRNDVPVSTTSLQKPASSFVQSTTGLYPQASQSLGNDFHRSVHASGLQDGT
eukprot:779302-Rhodomonas_salina.2